MSYLQSGRFTMGRVAELESLDRGRCRKNIPMKTGRLKYDLAYGCFLFCGMTALLITLFGKAAKDDNTAALLGFFVAIPFALASFAAMVAALVLSAILWRHWPLLILSALTVLSVTLITVVHGSEAFYNSAAILYAVGVFVMVALWFLVLRKKHFRTAVEE